MILKLICAVIDFIFFSLKIIKNAISLNSKDGIHIRIIFFIKSLQKTNLKAFIIAVSQSVFIDLRKILVIFYFYYIIYNL